LTLSDGWHAIDQPNGDQEYPSEHSTLEVTAGFRRLVSGRTQALSVNSATRFIGKYFAMAGNGEQKIVANRDFESSAVSTTESLQRSPASSLSS
jgi:hypothetical protein